MTRTPVFRYVYLHTITEMHHDRRRAKRLGLTTAAEAVCSIKTILMQVIFAMSIAFVNPLALPRYTHVHKGISRILSVTSHPNIKVLTSILSLCLPPTVTPQVHKRRIRHPPPLLAIKTLQQNPLVVINARPVIPPLVQMRHRNHLAGLIQVLVLDRHQRIISHGLGVGERERRALRRAVQGALDVDDADAVLEKSWDFVGEEGLYAPDRRCWRLVDMDAQDRGPVSAYAVVGVVEHERTFHARDVLQEKLFDLGVSSSLWSTPPKWNLSRREDRSSK